MRYLTLACKPILELKLAETRLPVLMLAWDAESILGLGPVMNNPPCGKALRTSLIWSESEWESNMTTF